MSKVIYARSPRFHVEVTDDPAHGWRFNHGYDDEEEARDAADGVTAWKYTRVTDTGEDA